MMATEKKPLAKKIHLKKVKEPRFLMSMLKLVAMDNDLYLKDTITFPENLDELEEQAKRLTYNEKVEVACGEWSEQKKIIRKHKVQKLNEYICAAFDGDESDNVFVTGRFPSSDKVQYKAWLEKVKAILEKQPARKAKSLLLALSDWESQDEPFNVFTAGYSPKQYATTLLKDME